MTRATEAAGGEAHADSSDDSKSGPAASKKVCPFCGAINDNDGNACPRCLMEDTQTTRSATKSRIGPWFVLQARNPAAPGMKWNTLIDLVRRGVVVPRSIVRGPTTHQLWRAAGHVKGLSREFGLCYHCGGEIDKAANQCPHCNKLQEPPINPDSLLEVREPMIKRELPREAGAPQRDGSQAPQAVSMHDADPIPMQETPEQREIRANAQLDTLAADLERFVSPVRSTPPAPANLPTDFVIPRPADRNFSRPDSGILSAKELAAAFQLDFQPGVDEDSSAPIGSPKPPGKSHPILRTFVLLMFLAAIGAVTFFGLKPDYREQAIAWLEKNYASVKSSIQTRPAPPSMGTSTPNPPKTEPQVPDAPGAIEPKPPMQAPPVAPAPHPEPEATKVVEQATNKAMMSWDDAYDQYKKLYVEAQQAESNTDYRLALEKYQAIQKLRSDVWPKDLNERIATARRHLP